MRRIHKFRWWVMGIEWKFLSLVTARCGAAVRSSSTRVSWKRVTCKNCLRLKGKVDKDRLLRDIT